jgi:hypothetical protein
MDVGNVQELDPAVGVVLGGLVTLSRDLVAQCSHVPTGIVDYAVDFLGRVGLELYIFSDKNTFHRQFRVPYYTQHHLIILTPIIFDPRLALTRPV